MAESPTACPYCGLADPGPEHRSYAPSLCADRGRTDDLPNSRDAIATALMKTGMAPTFQIAYRGADGVLAWLRGLSLVDLAAVLSQVGYDVTEGVGHNPTGSQDPFATLVVAAKEPTAEDQRRADAEGYRMTTGEDVL